MSPSASPPPPPPSPVGAVDNGWDPPLVTVDLGESVGLLDERLDLEASGADDDEDGIVRPADVLASGVERAVGGLDDTTDAYEGFSI